MCRIQVLLSTYNGERYIQELLKSVAEQKSVELEILVRDDGSKDNTLKILEQYTSNMRVRIVPGENLGFAQSFWQLVKVAGGADYYAFCDQDDIWLEDKLISAVRLLENENNGVPMLYTSNVTAVNKNLETLKEKAFPFEGVLSFANSLKRSVLPGCTFVFNDALLKKAQMYDGFLIAHDWLMYIICSAFGKVIYDDKVHMLYRIHGNNEIGIESKFNQYIKAVKRFFKPEIRNARSKVVSQFLSVYEEQLDEEKKKLVTAFSEYKNDIRYLWTLMKTHEYQDLIFTILLLFKKV